MIGNFEWMACFILILLALMFAPFYINSGVATLPEFMERRYCPAARTFLAVIGILGALLIHIGISLFAAAKVFETLLGVPMFATILVLSLFTVTYAALGGLKAVVMTESIQVVLLLGDGAFGFSGMDFDTLARHGVNVVGVMGNNGIWALEKHPMEFLYGYSVAADLRPGTRYDQVVEALGGYGELVERPGDLRGALERAFNAGKPALVNVLTDPTVVYPRKSNLA